jgi:hypothetical protein
VPIETVVEEDQMLTTVVNPEVKSRITGGPTRRVFHARIMGRHDISYFQCCETGFIQTEAPFWLAEAYASPINLSDTGILVRNSRFVTFLGPLLYCFFNSGSPFLDYAGGYGIFTRMMRDVGFDYLWADPYTTNLCARGFEYAPESGPVVALTAFEVFEHLADPLPEVRKMSRLAENLIFSTTLLPEPLPDIEEWWYYGLESGQHVSFYTLRALEVIARETKSILVSNRHDLHCLLRPTLLPQRIVSSWFKDWLESQPASTRGLVRSTYEFHPLPNRPGGLKQKIKNLLRRSRFSGLYVRKPDLAPGTLAALASTSLTSAYAEHLLAAGPNYWGVFTQQLESRTMSDRSLMRARMLSR